MGQKAKVATSRIISFISIALFLVLLILAFQPGEFRSEFVKDLVDAPWIRAVLVGLAIFTVSAGRWLSEETLKIGRDPNKSY